MKKNKLIMTVLFTCLIALAVLSGCQISGTMLDDRYQDDGYYKVTFFYNGGIADSTYYQDRFIPKNSRLPYPGANSSPISSPARTGYSLAGWYQIDSSRLEQREVERKETYVDDKGVETRRVVYDQAGDPVIDTQYYITDYDYMNDQLEQAPLPLAALNDEAINDIFVRDNGGNIKRWNFDIDRVKDDIVLLPLWKSMREYVYISEADSVIKPDDIYFDSKTYTYTRYLNDDGSIKKPDDLKSLDVPQIPLYQVEGLYLDSGLTTEVPYDDETGYYYPEETYVDGKIGRFPIYVRYISDSFTVINKPGDFYYNQDTQEYILEPDDAGGFKGLWLRADIDCGGHALNFRDTAGGEALTFSSDIRGNGYTISNFTVNIKQLNDANVYGGIFRSLGSGANIQNISFDDFTVNFKRSSNISGYLSRSATINAFSDDIPDTAVLREVHITNMKIIDEPASVLGTYIFRNDETSSSRVVAETLLDGTVVDIIRRVFGDKNSPELRSYIVTNADEWPSHEPISNADPNSEFGHQYGDKFGSTSSRIYNCHADVATVVPWQSGYIRTNVTSDNYYKLPNLPADTNPNTTHLFYGWFTDNGYQYGPGHPAPKAGESFTVYAMFTLVKAG